MANLEAQLEELDDFLRPVWGNHRRIGPAQAHPRLANVPAREDTRRRGETHASIPTRRAKAHSSVPSSVKGRPPCAISHTVQPSDQMSDQEPGVNTAK